MVKWKFMCKVGGTGVGDHLRDSGGCDVGGGGGGYYTGNARIYARVEGRYG
jgi:hypothetical protein